MGGGAMGGALGAEADDVGTCLVSPMNVSRPSSLEA